MQDSALVGDRCELVSFVVASADTANVALRPWRMEEALAVVAAASGRLAETAQWWLTKGSCGSAADGLELYLASLGRSGALVYSADWGVYVVDTWWRDEIRSQVALLGSAERGAIAAGAEKLDSLEGWACQPRFP